MCKHFILTYVNILENKIEQFYWDFNVHIHFYSNKFNLFFFFFLIPYLQRGYKKKNYKEPKKIWNGMCKALGLWGSLSTRILGLWPKSRTRTRPRRRGLRQKRLCWKIERWDLVILGLESVLRMKTSSARLGWALGRWFDSKSDDPINSVGVDKNCRDIR